jgi:hypothetical protein
MSERSPKRQQPHVQFGPRVEYTEEEGKAMYEESLRHDNGTAMVVQNALDTIQDGAHKGRNLLDVVVRLIGHMTPEQKRGLADRLPALLADDAPPPTNGVPHSEAG